MTLQRFIRATFGDGRRKDALAFVRDYNQLEKRLGAFEDGVVIQFACGVVMFQHEFQTAAALVRRTQDARSTGRGRRPSAREIERAKRRMGLSWQSYDSALRRLEELAKEAPRRGVRSLAERMALERPV